MGNGRYLPYVHKNKMLEREKEGRKKERKKERKKGRKKERKKERKKKEERKKTEKKTICTTGITQQASRYDLRTSVIVVHDGVN